MGGKLGTPQSKGLSHTHQNGVRRGSKLSSRHDWAEPVSRVRRITNASSHNPLFSSHDFETNNFSDNHLHDGAPLVKELRADKHILTELLYTYYLEQDYYRMMSGAIDVDAIVDSVFRCGLAELDSQLVLRYGVSIYKYINPEKHKMRRVSTSVPVHNLHRVANHGRGGVLERWGLSPALADRPQVQRRYSSYDRLSSGQLSDESKSTARIRSNSSPSLTPRTSTRGEQHNSSETAQSNTEETTPSQSFSGVRPQHKLKRPKITKSEREMRELVLNLESFLLEHDPEALCNGTKGALVTFTLSFGKDALEEKLMSKYGVGFQTSNPHYSITSSMRVKSLQLHLSTPPPVDSPTTWVVHPDDDISDEPYHDLRKAGICQIIQSFFEKMDPEKLNDGSVNVAQVAEWALSYGVPDLNYRLNYYYDADLSTVQPAGLLNLSDNSMDSRSTLSLPLSPEEIIRAEQRVARIASDRRMKRVLTAESDILMVQDSHVQQQVDNLTPEERRIRDTHARVKARLDRIARSPGMQRARKHIEKEFGNSTVNQTVSSNISENQYVQHIHGNRTSTESSKSSQWSESGYDGEEEGSDGSPLPARRDAAAAAAQKLAKELLETTQAARERTPKLHPPTGVRSKSNGSPPPRPQHRPNLLTAFGVDTSARTSSSRVVQGRKGVQVTSKKGSHSNVLRSQEIDQHVNRPRPRTPPPGAPLHLREQHALLLSRGKFERRNSLEQPRAPRPKSRDKNGRYVAAPSNNKIRRPSLFGVVRSASHKLTPATRGRFSSSSRSNGHWSSHRHSSRKAVVPKMRGVSEATSASSVRSDTSSIIRHKLSYVLHGFETASGKMKLEKLFDPNAPTPPGSTATSQNSQHLDSFSSSPGTGRSSRTESTISSETARAVDELMKVI